MRQWSAILDVLAAHQCDTCGEMKTTGAQMARLPDDDAGRAVIGNCSAAPFQYDSAGIAFALQPLPFDPGLDRILWSGSRLVALRLLVGTSPGELNIPSFAIAGGRKRMLATKRPNSSRLAY